MAPAEEKYNRIDEATKEWAREGNLEARLGAQRTREATGTSISREDLDMACR